MSEERALPWTDLVEALGQERLADIRTALTAEGFSDLSRDAFLLHRLPGALWRELVPEGGPAEAVNAYGTLLHMVYLLSARGWPLISISTDRLRARLASSIRVPDTRHQTPLYAQLPERLVWAPREPGAPHEPLDGMFILEYTRRLRVLAVLGLHDQREGFTTMEAELPLPIAHPGQRADGSHAFASVMPGGERAQLLSVVDSHELAWLGLSLAS